MDFTDFAGLTRLGPGDSLSEDGYSFQDLNPEIIDNLLRIGAVAHVHDAHDALADPTLDPTAAALTSGGTVPADTAVTFAYTLLDEDGGETLPNTNPQIAQTQAGLSDPDAAPDLDFGATAGTLLPGTYTYALTVTDDGGGETGLGPTASIDIPQGSATNEVFLSGLDDIVTASGGTGWRLWRSVNGGAFNLVESGSTDTLTDDGTLCPNCNEEPPTSGSGTTNATNSFEVTVPDGQPAGTVRFRIYGSLDGTFTTPALLGDYAAADLGTTKTFTAFDPTDGAPPERSRAVRGAERIQASDLLGLSEEPIGASLETDWSDNPTSPTAYWRDAMGMRHLRGRLHKATAPADGDVIFEVDVDHRPGVVRSFGVVSGDDANTAVFGAVELTVAGEVIWRAGATGTGNWISLDGINYPV